MLRISKKADYAVFLLGSIARQGAFPGGSAADSVVSAHEIARQAGLNKSVVANLLKEFAKNGLLESVRGLKGGYRLVRSPEQISLAEILVVVEGPFSLVDCIRHHEAARDGAGTDHLCSLIAFCPTKNPLRILHERIARMFHEITLAELAGKGPAAATTSARPVPAQPAATPAAAPPDGVRARNRLGVAK